MDSAAATGEQVLLPPDNSTATTHTTNTAAADTHPEGLARRGNAVPDEVLAPVLSLHHKGLMLQAYRLAEQHAPLRNWSSSKARILAGRLAFNLGAPRMAQIFHYLALRADPDEPEAKYYFARLTFERRGPLATWTYLRDQGDLSGAPREVRADWFAFHATVASFWRDFDTAEGWLRRAQDEGGDRPWTCIERAHLFEMEDRHEDALAAARRALELHPWYRPGVQAVAHSLCQLGRDEEAVGLLVEADQRLESAPVASQLAALQMELGRYDAALASLARVESLMPLMEKGVRQWLAARQADAASQAGDFEAAARFAADLKDPLLRQVVAPTSDGKRVVLPVCFVRQHHMTCAPATLSALSRFWDKPAGQIEIVEEICYDGTPAASERRWAEERGYIAREFTVTWEAAVALIDRGVPFTLTTVEATSAHLQAVIGYDSRRRTLVIREPSDRFARECIADAMLTRYAAHGPRGMTLCPREQAARLEGIELKDAALYDAFHALQRALLRHDRAEGARQCESLAARAPDHALTLQARRTLGAYDQHDAEILAAVDKLLALHSDDQQLLITKAHCLRALGRRDERIELLRALCRKKETDPIFHQQLGEELSGSALEREEAMQVLRRAGKYRALDASVLQTIAGILWDTDGRERAADLYRFAATVDDKDERSAGIYFTAARHLRRTEQVLEMLRGRFERFGRRSGLPIRTLFWACSQVEQVTEAMGFLERAIAWRPDDGTLLLFAADALARYGNFTRARELLERAKGRAQPIVWQRTAAYLALYEGELEAALRLWMEVLEATPLALDAHRAVAGLIAETKGIAAALDHLAAWVNRFPHHHGLSQLRIEWLRDDPAACCDAVRAFIAANPHDAWAQRELALTLLRLGRTDEALEPAQASLRAEPRYPIAHGVLGAVHAQAGRVGEAREAYRTALRLSVDAEGMIDRLLALCTTPAERRAELEFVHAELVRQVIFGDGLLEFARLAQGTLEPEELLALLRTAREARPDLWQTWAAEGRQLSDMSRFDEATALGQQMAERFPLTPVVWMELATHCRLKSDREGEREALKAALRISPSFGQAARNLAETYSNAADFAGARDVLERAVARAPLDAFNHGCLADVLWKLGLKDEALSRVAHALRIEPSYEWGWQQLDAWGRELGKPALAADAARALIKQRGGEARSWLTLARWLPDDADPQERIDAIDRAIALNPRTWESYTFKSQVLASVQRFDEAIAACTPKSLEGQPLPNPLRSQLARLQAQLGDLPRAIAEMREVVRDDPAYAAGWMNLVEWYCANGNKGEYLSAARQLASLLPHNLLVLGYLGDAKLVNGDRAGAKVDFRRAIELDPSYTFGAVRLLDLYLDEDDFEGHRALFAELKPHLPRELALSRQIRIEVRRDVSNEQLIDWFKELLRIRTAERWTLEAAAGELMNQGLFKRTIDALDEAIDLPDGNPAAADVWVRALATRDRISDVTRRVKRLTDVRTDGQAALLRAAVELFGNARLNWRLGRTVKRFREALRRDDESWAVAGAALFHTGRVAAALDWMSDWQSRRNLRGWMMLVMAMSHRQRGNDAQAHRLSLLAARLDRDHTFDQHLLWLAAEEAVSGDAMQSEQYLQVVNAETLDEHYASLRGIVEQTVRVRRQPPGPDRAAAFTDARKRVFRLSGMASAPANIPFKRMIQRLVKRMVRDRGGLGARLWYHLIYWPLKV